MRAANAFKIEGPFDDEDHVTVADATPIAQEVTVWAVVACFQPDLPAVATMVESLDKLGVRTVLVANSPIDAGWGMLPSTAVVLDTGSNNFARAINRGVAEASRNGATHVLLLDQDSDVETYEFAEAMIEYCTLLNPCSARPVVVGNDGVPMIDSDPPMTSGQLLSVVAFERAGGFDDSLVLDYSDIDFAFRFATAFGAMVPVVHSIRHRHNPGILRFRFVGPVRFKFADRSDERLRSIARGRVLCYFRWGRQFPRWAARDSFTWTKQQVHAFGVGGFWFGARFAVLSLLGTIDAVTSRGRSRP
jgi:hypothetical protein